MVTGFDILSHDKRLQRHWLYRSAAFIMDALLIILPLTIVLWLMDETDIVLIGLLSCIVFYLVSAAVEVVAGATFGKFMFGLRVQTLRNDNRAGRIFLRNLTRLFWFVLPPLDFALGMSTRGDPRQRLLDRIAGTTVTVESERKWHESHLKEFTEPATEETEEIPEEAMAEPEPVIAGEEPVPEPQTVREEKCRECQGTLMMLADQKYQCQECGLIQ